MAFDVWEFERSTLVSTFHLLSDYDGVSCSFGVFKEVTSMANNIRRAFFFNGVVKDLFLVTFDYITFDYITFDRLRYYIPQN